MIKESAWYNQYIDLNTNIQSKASNEFEKDFFKLMNSLVFGEHQESSGYQISQN